MIEKLKNVKIPKELLCRWEFLGKHILDWRHKVTGKRLFKFMWQPESKEFLMVYYPFDHKYACLNCGSHKFHEYVRGIFFKEKNIVYLRMHERKDWLKETEKMLRENNLPQDIKVMWGKDAYKILEEDLKDL
mgnify:CR=1 FL=1